MRAERVRTRLYAFLGGVEEAELAADGRESRSLPSTSLRVFDDFAPTGVGAPLGMTNQKPLAAARRDFPINR